jgi:acyl-CoA synthetase (AMP-forming)/AMP-acid ligase II
MMEVPLTIASIMRYGTSVFGDREVVTWTGDGTRRRTYAEAGRRAAQLANALRELGVDADQRVGTFMWNNAEHLEAYLAIPSMGAVLHTLNIRLATNEVGYIATHAEDYAIIVDASLVSRLAEILPQAPTVKHVIVTGGPLSETPGTDQLTGVTVHSYEDLLAAQPGSFDWPELDETSAAAMCYTSGTTGNPKGIVYSHRSAYLHSLGVCLGNAFGLSERDRVLPVVPMFHANAWGLAYASVISGAALIMPDKDLSPPTLVRLIGEEKVTVAGGVPTIWAGVLTHMRAEGGDLSSLRVVLCGGSAVPHALQYNFGNEFGVRILQAWGMTETSPLASVANPPPGLSEEQEWSYRESGPAVLHGGGPAVRGRRRAAAERRRGSRRDRGPRPLDHRLLLQGRRPGQVPRRLAAHRRRRDAGRARLHPADRPVQGRDQVRRRVDLLDGTREYPDGPPGRGRGRGVRRPRREVGGAPARGCGALVVAALASSRALVLHRRSAQDERGQVLQAADAGGVPARRLRDHRGPLTLPAWMLCLARLCAGTLWPTAR